MYMSVFTILYQNVKWRFHNSFTIVITILQPILWLVLYSAVAGQTMKNTGIGNYTAFILPGIVVLVSFSACSSGIMNYMMKSDGSFYRVLIAPM
jgi:ABC-2 type transport system permease protein